MNEWDQGIPIWGGGWGEILPALARDSIFQSLNIAPIEPIEPSVLGLSPSLLGGSPVRFPQLDSGPG